MPHGSWGQFQAAREQVQGVLVAADPRGDLDEHADRGDIGGCLLQVFAQQRLGGGSAVLGREQAQHARVSFGRRKNFVELFGGLYRILRQQAFGVGRYTSPDTMVSQLKRGVLDMIGCARPSIADPFSSGKIEEGRVDDIRERIGCNICVSSNMTISAPSATCLRSST